MRLLRNKLKKSSVVNRQERTLFEFLDNADIPIYLDIPEWKDEKVRKELKNITVAEFLNSESPLYRSVPNISGASAKNIIRLIKKEVDEASGSYFPVIAIWEDDIEGFWPNEWEELRGLGRSSRAEIIIQELLKTGNRPVKGDLFNNEGMYNELLPTDDAVSEVVKVRFVPLVEGQAGEFLTWVLLKVVN